MCVANSFSSPRDCPFSFFAKALCSYTQYTRRHSLLVSLAAAWPYIQLLNLWRKEGRSWEYTTGRKEKAYILSASCSAAFCETIQEWISERRKREEGHKFTESISTTLHAQRATVFDVILRASLSSILCTTCTQVLPHAHSTVKRFQSCHDIIKPILDSIKKGAFILYCCCLSYVLLYTYIRWLHASRRSRSPWHLSVRT